MTVRSAKYGRTGGVILAQLKAETREAHARAEAALNLLAPDLGRARYVYVLRGLHAVYTPLCMEIDRWLSEHEELDWPARRAAKLEALAEDLRVLNADADMPPAATVQPLPDEAHAWGTLYVLEGATLGGQLLCRHLAGQLHLDVGVDTGLAFFRSYGEQVGPRWKAFGAALEARCVQADAAFHTGVLAGAGQTFALFSALAVRDGVPA